MSELDAIERARALVDRVHEGDPVRTESGEAAELVYADRMESWVTRLVPGAPPLLRLAARCQHLERWAVPREAYAMDRRGYNAWRRELYRRQAARAHALLVEAGIPPTSADEVATWVAKSDLQRNPGSQTLEDAACLVFLEFEIARFAEKHREYPREKMLTILARIWRKMSPEARSHAAALEMAPAFRDLLEDASASGG